MSGPMGVGFIGTGGIADFHYHGLIRSEAASLLGIAGSNAVSLEKRAARWNTRGYRSVEDLLGSDEIQAVHILTPSHLHYEQVLQALGAGKHVMVEKPACATVEQVERIMETAARKGLVCVPNHNHLYSAGILEAKMLIDEGRLGKIVHCELFASGALDLDDWGWRSRLKTAGGGALMDSGTHLIYQALHLLGPCRRVKALTGRFLCKIEGEDTAALLLEHECGALSTIVQSWASKDHSESSEVSISGTQGQLWIGNPLYANTGLYVNGKKVLDGWNIETTFEKSVADFYAAIREGRPTVSNLEQAAGTLKVVEAAYNDAKERAA